MAKRSQPGPLHLQAHVLQSIRQHARSSMEAEICGVLLGSVSRNEIRIDGSIAGEHAAQGMTHVTFTQETWEHIYRIKDRDYPDRSILGWYHSHPGFGVFLSDYDLFIHENFFPAPHQIAWVYDPHSDEEGCFGWRQKKVTRLRSFTIVDDRQTLEPGVKSEPLNRDAAPRSWRETLRSVSRRLAASLRPQKQPSPTVPPPPAAGPALPPDGPDSETQKTPHE